MKITFYGTRGILPVGAQMSCAWVDAPAGAFVIDLGASHLMEDAARVAALDRVLLTHLHADHIAMLPRLLLEKPECLFVAPEPLPGTGGCQLATVPDQWCGLRLEAALTNHRKKNYAYKLSDDAVSVVWTGDGSYAPELVEFCRGADVIVCEATLREMPERTAIALGHMTPSLFARLMNEAAPTLAVATHFSELDPPAFCAEVTPRLHASIELVAATDGWVLDLD